MRERFELAHVINSFSALLLAKSKLTPLQLKVLGKIAVCRTAALGGHEEACENCGTVRYSYNSCGDRHCLPRWILKIRSNSESYGVKMPGGKTGLLD